MKSPQSSGETNTQDLILLISATGIFIIAEQSARSCSFSATSQLPKWNSSMDFWNANHYDYDLAGGVAGRVRAWPDGGKL